MLKGGSVGSVLVQERGFLVLTGMPRLVLGESPTTPIKDYVICLPHKNKEERKVKGENRPKRPKTLFYLSITLRKEGPSKVLLVILRTY